MTRLPLAAALVILCAAAAWGAQAETRVTTQASGRLPPVTVPAPGPATGSDHRGADVQVPVAGRPPRPGTPWFLTIGDSITFGFTRNTALAGTNISWALRVERLLAARGRRWQLFDTACPGESTLSYSVRCPGRRQVPVLGGRSQRSVALDAIAAGGADLRLIVVALGSNDLLQALTADPAVIQARLITHLEAIVAELHGAAPRVPIVLADMYDPFAIGAPRTDAVLSPIDGAVAALASRLGAGFADFHAAINHPADATPLCDLIDCADLDIHPTALGQERLAAAVMRALPAPA